jgi:hypothetical protein
LEEDNFQGVVIPDVQTYNTRIKANYLEAFFPTLQLALVSPPSSPAMRGAKGKLHRGETSPGGFPVRLEVSEIVIHTAAIVREFITEFYKFGRNIPEIDDDVRKVRKTTSIKQNNKLSFVWAFCRELKSWCR